MATYSKLVLDDIKRVCERIGHKDLLISVDNKFQLPNAQTPDKRYVTGLTAVARHLSAQDKRSLRSRAEKAAELQWMEFRTKRIDPCGGHNERDRKQLLQDLNGHLERRSYLTGSNLDVVDYIVYLGLAPILVNETSLLERELYPHVGRWFQLVRENWCAASGNIRRPSETARRQIIFSKTPL